MNIDLGDRFVIAEIYTYECLFSYDNSWKPISHIQGTRCPTFSVVPVHWCAISTHFSIQSCSYFVVFNLSYLSCLNLGPESSEVCEGKVPCTRTQHRNNLTTYFYENPAASGIGFDTGFSHRLTPYKIVGPFFGRSYLRLVLKYSGRKYHFRIRNISVTCPHN